MTRRILGFATPEALGEAVARDVMSRLSGSTGHFLLGCPGGRSPRPVYAALSRLAAERGVDLSRLIIVMMDEYLTGDFSMVPEDMHFSCRRFARLEIQAVLNRGLAAAHRVPDAQVWFPDPADPAAYDRRIDGAGGIDLFLLASGAGDGHVAFNPPGSDPSSVTRIVALAEQTRADNLATFPQFRSLAEVPHHGISVGIATIAHARASAMLVWGSGKQVAYRHLARAEVYDPGWPATVWACCPDATLYADHAAQGEA